MITLCVVTDGRRECIEQTIPSALDMLHGPITRKIIYDDSGDAEQRDWLRDRFPGFIVAFHEDGRQGFGGAIRHMWRWFSWNETNPYLFWLEDDFVFERDVDLDAMISVLEQRPGLLQMVLRRQAWNENERAAGGVVESFPDDFTDCHDGHNDWLEHVRFWSTNPHLCRMSITRQGWPKDPHSEGQFTQRMLRNPETRFGYWGALDSGTWVTHIGQQRVGHGY